MSRDVIHKVTAIALAKFLS